MKSNKPSRLSTMLTYSIAVILVLLPFHALFTTWIGSNFGHLDLFRIWKELLLVPVTLAALWLGWKDKIIHAWFKQSKLFYLIVAYIFLQILLGLVSYLRHEVNTNALIYALLINTRFLIFFVVCWVVGRNSDWLIRHYRKLILWPAALVIVFGLLQQTVLPADFLRHFGYRPDTIPAYQTVDLKSDYVRLQSTLRGANPLGAYLVLITTLTFGALLRYKKQKAWWGAFMAAAIIVLFFTYSRSAYLGASLSLGALAYWQVKDTRRRKQLLLVLSMVVILLGYTVVALRQNNTVQNTVFHSDETSRSSESSNHARLDALKVGVKSLANEPFGRGSGTAGPASFRNSNHLPRIAENYYLQVGEEVGIVGLIIFLGINLLVAQALWRIKNDWMAAVLLSSLIGLTFINMISHAWADDTLAYLWWGLAGITLTADIIDKKRKNNGRNHSTN